MKSNLFLWFRFGLVGLLVAGIYAALYHLQLSFFGMRALPANFIAFWLAVAIQYVLHATFTFRRRKMADTSQIARFAVTVGLGYLLSWFVTSVLAPSGIISEWIGTAIIIICLPIVNLVVLTVWVFAGKNDKPSKNPEPETLQ